MAASKKDKKRVDDRQLGFDLWAGSAGRNAESESQPSQVVLPAAGASAPSTELTTRPIAEGTLPPSGGGAPPTGSRLRHGENADLFANPSGGREPVDPSTRAQMPLTDAQRASPTGLSQQHAQNASAQPLPTASEPPLAKVIPLPTAFRNRAVVEPAPVRTEEKSVEVVENTDEIELPQGLRLERNLALLAGAGAGKTYSLVTICLHLLGGARTLETGTAEPLKCSQLGLLTFTDKAAGEMRARLRQRLEGLANGTAAEPELRASFEAAGQPFPPQAFWRRVRDELGGASIGTFHSLCTQLLRRAPPGVPFNSQFELLDEREAKRLVREVIERVLLERVQAGHAEVRALVSELGFGGSNGAWGLVDALAAVFSRIREEGLSPQFVQVSDPAVLRRKFDRALKQLKDATVRGFAVVTKNRDRLERFDRILREMTFETVPEQVPKLRDEIKKLSADPFSTLAPFVRPPKDGDDAESNLSMLHGACVMAPHEAAVREVLTEVAHEHRQLLERLGVLDFTALLVHARDLLRDSLEARRDAQARFKALLVDEFQDTNRLQLELVLLLAEKRAQAPRPLSTAFEAQHEEISQLPIEPAFLAVVGDRKQAIYEFRGADVSVFEIMARCIERHGGGRAYLRHSRRSSPSLVRALNISMTRLLGRERYGGQGSVREFEVVYQPQHDDLIPVRTRECEPLPFIRLRRDSVLGESAEQLRHADADAVARWAARALGESSTHLTVPAADAEPLRRLRGGDIALLFQRFTQLEVYRQALVQHGVRHRVVRGRGFYAAQEVIDVACCLSLIASPDDAMALAAVLRSPLVGLTDDALVELALPRGLSARAVLEEGLRPSPSATSPLSLTKLERFVETWRTLHGQRDRLGLRALLNLVFEGTQFRVAAAAMPFGDQALANLEKLLELASVRERSGVGVAAFARELLELAELEPTEAQGDVVDELDADAVTLCTVHQAKGLEWPVVVLPDLSAVPNAQTGSVVFDRIAGLGVKPLASDEGELESFSFTHINKLRGARAAAERARLLYVAMTRARDLVVFGPWAEEKPRSGTWAADLHSLYQWGDVRDFTREIDVASLPMGSAVHDETAVSDAAAERVREVVRRVRQPAAVNAERVVLPVTHLQEFVACPRRYHYARQVGLSERPPSFDTALDPLDNAAIDVRERGTAAHRLLELTPLDAVGAQLQPSLEAIRRAEGLESVAGDDVLEWVTRFWTSRFGVSLPSLGEGRVHRELPFVMTLEPARGSPFSLVLRGQIDLLVQSNADEVLVVDYKTATCPAAGLEPYRFQLACYALAAARFMGDSFKGRIRAGISFLRETDVEPMFLDSMPELAALERELAHEARALVTAQVEGHWAGRSRERCQALHCGFIYRCHGDDPTKT